MSQELTKEGEVAKREREAREAVHKLVDSFTTHHQIIIISKDMSGKTPFHVHCAGPLGDIELLSGMCTTASHTIQSKNVNKDIPK